MKSVVYRSLASIALSLVFVLPCYAEVSVVGCVYDSSAPKIGDDPNQCPSDRRLDILSVKSSFTQTASSAGSGGGAGKVSFQDLHITKHLDKASVALFKDVATGKHLPGVLVVVFEANGRGAFQRVFSILIEDVLVSSLEYDAADSSARSALPVDQVAFNFAKITIQDNTTNTTTSFDVTQNRLE
jgi:type VI secretion system Hcp family effector